MPVTKYRTVLSYDLDAIEEGDTGHIVTGAIPQQTAQYSETYTVKWGYDTASSHRFATWNPNQSTEARINGQRVSTLIIWEYY